LAETHKATNGHWPLLVGTAVSLVGVEALLMSKSKYAFKIATVVGFIVGLLR
jgi:hypothetical protein